MQNIIAENESLKKRLANCQDKVATISQGNIRLYDKVKSAEKEMPKAGKNLWAFLTAVFLAVLGIYIPSSPFSCCGASFQANLYQVTSVIVMLVLFAGPFVLRLAGAIGSRRSPYPPGGNYGV